MKTLKKIGIIGRISEKLCDGQTIKTRILVQELQRHYPECEIIIAESSDFKSKPLFVMRQVMRCIREGDIVFILLSRNGMRLLFPMIHLFNRLWKKPLLHDCIGGSLDEVVRLYPFLKKALNKFDVNWVETEGLKMKLDALGIKHAEVLPNFKPLVPLKLQELKRPSPPSFRFCTFSRVNKAKGIDQAAQAVIDINHDAGKPRVTLDIYGPIEENYASELQSLIDASSGAIRYRGIIAYQDSVSVLKSYDMLLFPTTFYGEGFPGTLVDALSAGLPVIATDWHCNSEIIADGITGFLYPVGEGHLLRELMEYALKNPERIFEMRAHCLSEAQKYTVEHAMAIIDAKIAQLLAHKEADI